MASLRLGFLNFWSLVKPCGVFEDPPLDVAPRIGKGAEKGKAVSVLATAQKNSLL